ncbi:hypothetical protein [Rhizobium sp. HT1-10]|uniref:hypothetical protein n=1 Tax=Rhizobium sp. HT1-10 TaxID=3111638 RepID=UPI003C28641B
MSIAAIIVLAFAALSAWGLVEKIKPLLDRNSRATLTIGNYALTGGTVCVVLILCGLTYVLYKAPSEAAQWDLECLSNAIQEKQAADGLKTICEADKDLCNIASKKPPFDACAILLTPRW